MKRSSLSSKVHGKVHSLKKQKQWSVPKIYHGGDQYDLSKDWYIYFSYRNPDTGLLQRQTNIKRGNHHKTKTKRLEVLELYRKALVEILEEGYSPYDKPVVEANQMTLEQVIDFAMKVKKETWSDNNYKTMTARVGVFKKFLKNKRLLNRPPEHLTKSVVNQFLDEVLHKTTAANRNNYKSGLSPLFTLLVVRDMVEENHFLKIPKMKTKPKGKKVFSKQLQQDVISWMQQNDPLLLQFVQIFTFGMIRPIEAVRLKVGDFNLQEGYFYVNSKQKSSKKKIISRLLMDVLPDMEGFHPDDYVLTKEGVGKWNRSDNGRREYFTKRFIAMRDQLKFDRQLKMYNFRHTIISELYRKLIAEHGRKKAIELLSEITGHSTEKALMHYIDAMDAHLPDDFSKYLRQE